MGSVKRLSEKLSGQIVRPGLDNFSPELAYIVAEIQGVKVKIDFMADLKGVNIEEVVKRREEVAMDIQEGDELKHVTIYVMSPLYVFMSRAANVIQLGRRDDHAIDQLNASIIILREFLLSLLEDSQQEDDPRGPLRDAMAVLMTLSKFLRTHEAGRVIHDFSENDPATILQHFMADERLDQRWRDLQLAPQIQKLRVSRERREERGL